MSPFIFFLRNILMNTILLGGEEMEREYEVDRNPCCPGSLARACVPFQIMNQVFSPREALKKGTLFPELYQPYIIEEDREGGCRYYG